MHPYWIQKIEESRRSAVTTFWTVVFLVVVLPIILVMKVDMFFVIAIICFAAAGLRMFSQGKSEMMLRAEAASSRLRGDAKPESGASGLAPGTESGTQWQSTHPPTMFPGPQVSNGVPTMPEFTTSQPHGGVPTDPFGHAAQSIYNPQGAPSFAVQPVTETFLTGSIAPGQPLISDVIHDFSTTQSSPQSPASQLGQPVSPGSDLKPDMVQPKRPMHFHDMARHS